MNDPAFFPFRLLAGVIIEIERVCYICAFDKRYTDVSISRT